MNQFTHLQTVNDLQFYLDLAINNNVIDDIDINELLVMVTPHKKKENEKCLLLVRVSSEQQDLVQQTNKVKEEALKDGFSEDDIIIIEDKESGVLLSEEERNGLNRLKKHVKEDNIQCVYTYEVSRISRKPSVLYSIRDFLIEHKVQLVILNPYMKMLKDDGMLSETANIYFGIFTAMAESEGFIRKARMKRGVLHKKALGLHYGGSISIGYKTDKQDRYIIDEEGASIVRRIFNDYVNGSSVRKLAKDLQNEGWRTKTAYLTVVQSILNILHREYYTGNDGIHPAIISEELYQAAQNKCKKQRVYAIPKDEIVLLKGLVYDRKSGLLLSANRINGCYYCKRCKGPTISWKVLDPIIWTFVQMEHSQRFIYDRGNWLKEVDSEMKRNEKIIETMNDNIVKMKEVINRIEERYIEGKITKEKADELEAKHIALLKTHKDTKKQAEETIERLYFEKKNSVTKIDYDKLDMKQRIELVRKCIRKIVLWRYSRFIVKLEVQMTWPDIWDFTINTREHKVLKWEKRYNPKLISSPKNLESPKQCCNFAD